MILTTVIVEGISSEELYIVKPIERICTDNWKLSHHWIMS